MAKHKKHKTDWSALILFKGIMKKKLKKDGVKLETNSISEIAQKFKFYVVDKNPAATPYKWRSYDTVAHQDPYSAIIQAVLSFLKGIVDWIKHQHKGSPPGGLTPQEALDMGSDMNDAANNAADAGVLVNGKLVKKKGMLGASGFLGLDFGGKGGTGKILLILIALLIGTKVAKLW